MNLSDSPEQMAADLLKRAKFLIACRLEELNQREYLHSSPAIQAERELLRQWIADHGVQQTYVLLNAKKEAADT